MCFGVDRERLFLPLVLSIIIMIIEMRDLLLREAEWWSDFRRAPVVKGRER